MPKTTIYRVIGTTTAGFDNHKVTTVSVWKGNDTKFIKTIEALVNFWNWSELSRFNFV